MSVTKKLKRLRRRVTTHLGRPRLEKQVQAIVVDDLEYCENPIFLIGCHRSGTTLVRRLFNSHKSIACPPETVFLRHYAAMLKDPLTFAGYSGLGYERDEMARHIRQQAARLHEAFRISSGKARWADKTPQYVSEVDGLKALFGDGAHFVMIFRHPFDTAASLIERQWFYLKEYEDKHEDTVAYVAKCHSAQLKFLDENPATTSTLFYEDLNADPEAALTPVLEAFGEPYDPEMLNFFDKSHNFGLEDPSARGVRGLSVSMGNWSDWTDKQIAMGQKHCGASAARLGYDLTRAGLRAPRRARKGVEA